MPRFESFKNVSQGILHWFLILVISLVGVWLFFSIAGNILLSRQNRPITEPNIDKARYAVLIRSTREVMFTDKYNTAYHVNFLGQLDKNFEVYTLQGYYELKGRKYIWNKQSSPPLDEFYFGPIDVMKRQEINQ